MKKRGIVCIVLLLFALAAGMSGCGKTASEYTEEEHLERIEQRARKRFLGEESEYTDLEVFPIYDENDEFKYALIELQPKGFIYVSINSESYLEWVGGPSMYLMNTDEARSWIPYRFKEGVYAEWEDENGKNSMKNAELFYDENGNYIRYDESHFAIAGIEGERRYFLATPRYDYTNYPDDYEHKSYELIPAVKRGDQYLDLVDGALIDYEPDVYSPTYALGQIYFNIHFGL